MTPLQILDFGFWIANCQSAIRQFAIPRPADSACRGGRNQTFAMGRQVVG